MSIHGAFLLNSHILWFGNAEAVALRLVVKFLGLGVWAAEGLASTELPVIRRVSDVADRWKADASQMSSFLFCSILVHSAVLRFLVNIGCEVWHQVILCNLVFTIGAEGWSQLLCGKVSNLLLSSDGCQIVSFLFLRAIRWQRTL